MIAAARIAIAGGAAIAELKRAAAASAPIQLAYARVK
jgi:hypothetical protein